MKNQHHHLLLTALTCSQLLLCGGSITPSWGADQPASAIAAKPEIAIIKDQSVFEVFLRFSPDGKELVRIPQFGPVCLSDTATFKKVRTFEVGMRMIAYSPDGTKMATAEGTDGARIWDFAAKGRKLEEAAPAQVEVLEKPLQVLQAPSPDRGQRVLWTEFSPDGKHLVTSQGSGHVKIWSTDTWKVEDDLTLTDQEVRAVVFSPDSKTLVFGDVTGKLFQWSLEKKAPIESALTKEKLEPVFSVAFAPDGKTLVTTHQSDAVGRLRIWNTNSWAAQLEEGFSCAAFSKDGKTLALGGGSIKLLDPASGKTIRTIELAEMTIRDLGAGFADAPDADQKVPVQITALAFSPDGTTLAVGNRGPLHLVKLDAKSDPKTPRR